MSSSSVYYKFKSQREPSRVIFDGSAISVWDLKREIILQNKMMGKGLDFNLGVYNPDTDEEYRDDNLTIPRASTVIVRRLPPSKPGRGTAQMYVADLQADAGESSGRFSGAAAGQSDRNKGPAYRGPMSIRFDGKAAAGGSLQREGSSSVTPAPAAAPPAFSGEQGGDTEAASIAAMFQATTDQWDATQERMSHATYRPRGGGPFRGGPPRPPGGRDQQQQPQHYQPPPDRPPPTGYICYRCGQKGHWIQECPTNKDPDWDNKPRFKRTTGIPKSMLKTVEAPTDEQRQAGVMITADGTYVVAQVDNAAWERVRNQVKPLSRSDVYQSVPSDSSMACPLCSKLIRSAVQTPCCGTRYCEECVQNHLIEHDFTCAECEQRIADLGNLKRDDELRKKIEKYVEESVEKSETEIKEREEKEEEEAKAREAALAAEEEAAAEKLKKEEEEEAAAKAKEAEEEAAKSGKVNGNSNGPSMPSNVPTVAFNPQLAQQLVMTLSNPQLPPPMRMMFQVQLQAQQMAFMRLQQGGNNATNGSGQGQMGIGGGIPNMGMGMGMGGMMGGGANWQQLQQNGFNRPSGPMQMGMSMNNNATGNGNGFQRGPPQQPAWATGGRMKRERDQDFVELGGEANKSVRTG